MPALRIVDDGLWQAVQARYAGVQKKWTTAEPGKRFNQFVRPKYLFTGMTKCGECSAGFVVYYRDRLGCFGTRERGTCTNKLTIADTLEQALTGEAYQEFSFRRKDQPFLLDNGAVNMEFAVTYRGQPWTSISVDLARAETGESEVEWVEAIALTDAFGVTGPALLPCLPLRFHVAQKLHGLTLPPRPGKQNERFRDLVDLLLMEALVTHDYVALRAACELVFRSRSWPLDLAAMPPHWKEPFAQLAVELDLPETDVEMALVRVRGFVARILRSSS